jgi:cytochrome P450
MQRLADDGTAELVEMLWAGDKDSFVARVSLMVQGCGGTAGLIGMALYALHTSPGATTDTLLAEVLRRSPPVRATLRVASSDVVLAGKKIGCGETVVCDIAAASLDGEASKGPSLAFGYGIRPCPGQSEAMMLAAGVVDAVREACTIDPGQSIDFEPSARLRVPQCLVAELR